MGSFFDFLTNGGFTGQGMGNVAGSPYQGLLSEQARAAARNAALMQLGGGLIAASGRTTDPGYNQRALGQTLAQFPGQFQGLLDTAAERQAFENELKQRNRQQGEFSKYAGGLDPTTGINWETGRQAGGRPAVTDPQTGKEISPAVPASNAYGLPQHMEGLLGALGPEQGTGLLADYYLGGNDPMKAPKVVERFNEKTGRREKVQWNSQTRQWEPLGGQEADFYLVPGVSP